MTREQIVEIYGILFDDFHAVNDRSWSDVIHYDTQRELLLSYDEAPDYFDMIRYMRAECIRNAVYYVPTVVRDGRRECFHYQERADLAIPLFSTMEEAALLYEYGEIPSIECCEEILLLDLINLFEEDVVFHINPLTECQSVKRSYYISCLALAEHISEDRVKKILDARRH